MRILIFNLRDTKHPNSGGAEVFTHEVAKRWVCSGNDVTMVTSNFKNGANKEIIDGIEIVRLGNIYTVHSKAKKYYQKYLDYKFDVIIDEYTFKPFLTPTFAKGTIIFLVHEMAREKYFYELPPILSHIFYYYVEPRWFKYYINTPTVTVSNSTRKDLLNFNLKDVNIVPEGINFMPIEKVADKEETPTLIYVGLLKKSNLVDHAIEAFRLVSKALPHARLWVVGRGSALEKLRKVAKGLNVEFFGYVEEKKKLELMRKAHVLVIPAIREGWGLVVTEANACATPAVGYNVNGLKDSIKDRETGLLSENNPKALAKSILTFLNNKNLQQQLTENGLKWSKTFSWDRTAYEFMKVIKQVSSH